MVCPRIFKVSSGFFAVFAAALFPYSRAYALSVRALLNGGYEKITVDSQDESKDISLSGYTVGALAGVGILDSIPGFSLLALGALRQESLKHEAEGIELTLNSTLVGAEVGPEFSLIPLLRIQALVGYDYKLSGKIKSKIDGLGTDAQEDLSQYGRFNVTGRALLTLAPTISLGLEPSYHSGSFKAKGEDSEKQNFTGFSAKAVVAFTL
jgi:hypothetical protein